MLAAWTWQPEFDMECVRGPTSIILIEYCHDQVQSWARARYSPGRFVREYCPAEAIEGVESLKRPNHDGKLGAADADRAGKGRMSFRLYQPEHCMIVRHFDADSDTHVSQMEVAAHHKHNQSLLAETWDPQSAATSAPMAQVSSSEFLNH